MRTALSSVIAVDLFAAPRPSRVRMDEALGPGKVPTFGKSLRMREERFELLGSDLGDDGAKRDLPRRRESKRLDAARGNGDGVHLEKPDRLLLRALVLHEDPVDLAQLGFHREVPLDESQGGRILGVHRTHGCKSSMAAVP